MLTIVHLLARRGVLRRGASLCSTGKTRSFSEEIIPILNTESLQHKLRAFAPSIASSLRSQGFWTNECLGVDNKADTSTLLEKEEIIAMRDQSIALRSDDRFEQSWSERIDEMGVSTRFDKEGVFACEPDGADYYTAPDLLLYMSTVISTLPPLLNEHVNTVEESSANTKMAPLNLSNQAFNAKLAVTSPGGSTYPLHVDNTLGITGSPQDDSRKLTCIVYLNPDYKEGDGGELRLLLLDKECLDLTPRGGRMVIFWSDEIPHEVLPTKPDSQEECFDRYALTIWLPDNDPRNIQASGSKFESLRVGAFVEGENWC